MKSLQEILQELVNHCTLITGEDVHLKLHLPLAVLEKDLKIAKPKEKIVLLEESNDTKIKNRKFVLFNGTVELES